MSSISGDEQTHKHEQSWFRSGWSLSDLNFSNPGQELPNKQTNREKTLKKKKKTIEIEGTDGQNLLFGITQP